MQHQGGAYSRGRQVSEGLIIGYYPFRAKAQVLRLLCQYLHIDYQDCFLNPDDWSKYRENDAKKWVVRDLPFLQDGDFILTGNNAMITYVIELSQCTDLLGRTLEHKIKIDNYRAKGDIKDTILGFLCNNRWGHCHQKNQQRKFLNEIYQKKICHLMEMHEQECIPDNFYFGYLTYLDFAIYEIVNYFRLLFPQEVVKFNKLIQIRNRVAAIPQIFEYERSPRAVQEYCPIKYFRTFREEKLRNYRQSSSVESTQPQGKMQRRVQMVAQ